MKSNLLPYFLFFFSLIILASCGKEDDTVGPFHDTLPVLFSYDTVANFTNTKIYIPGEEDKIYTTSNRENEINKLIAIAAKQLNSIKIISVDRATLSGATRENLPFSLDTKYTQSGKTYTFTGSFLGYEGKYTSTRSNDTMTLKGLMAVRYRNGQLLNNIASIQASGYQLSDEKSRTQSGDTLYYKECDLLLLKKK